MEDNIKHRFTWNPQRKEEFRALATALRFKNDGQLQDEAIDQGIKPPCLDDVFLDSVAEVFSRNRKGKAVSSTLLVEWRYNAKLLLADNQGFHAADEQFRGIVEKELREVASQGNLLKYEPSDLPSVNEDISSGENALWEAIITHQNNLHVDAANLREQLEALLSLSLDCNKVEFCLKTCLAKLLGSIPISLSQALAPAAISPTITEAYEICRKFTDNDFIQICGDEEKATSLKQLILEMGQPRNCFEVMIQKAKTNSESFANLEIVPLPIPRPSVKRGKWDYAKVIAFIDKLEDMKAGTSIESKFGGDRKANAEKFNKFRKPLFKVHAEVQLATYVATQGYLSDPNVKISDYIGCNKPTCFLCDRFLRKQNRYRTRECSNRIFNGWAVPDTLCCSEDEACELQVAVDEMHNDLKHEICCEWE